MRLKGWVIAACFLGLGAFYAGFSAPVEPVGTESGVWVGRVSTVTARGAMLDSLWVSSREFAGKLDRGDSLLVLGNRRGRFVTPWAMRIKPAGGLFPSIRRRLLLRFRQTLPDSLALGMASAVLLGYRGLVPPKAATVFQLSGTGHLLALSGMHTGIVAGAILWISRLLFGRRSCGAVLAVCALAVFVLLTGARSSTLRAGIMAGSAILWIAFHGGPVHPLSVWCLALLPLAADPAKLADPGTQMSYGAVLSLILLGRSWRGRKAVLLSPLWAGVVVNVSLAPLTGAVYGRINPAGIVCTLISLPIMTAVMALGVLSGLGLGGGGLLAGLCRLWLLFLEIFCGMGFAFRISLRNMVIWGGLLLLLFLISRGRGFRRRFR